MERRPCSAAATNGGGGATAPDAGFALHHCAQLHLHHLGSVPLRPVVGDYRAGAVQSIGGCAVWISLCVCLCVWGVGVLRLREREAVSGSGGASIPLQ